MTPVFECFANTGVYAPGTMFPNRSGLRAPTPYARVQSANLQLVTGWWAQSLTLERDPQAELYLSGRTKRKHSCSDANAIYVVALGRRAVDLSCRPSEQPVERRRR